jgi:hypothetical protein
MIMTSDKVCGRWIDKKRNNSGERQKKKTRVYHGEERRGFVFCIEERDQMG